MNDQDHTRDRTFKDLSERARELDCLYCIEAVLSQPPETTEELLRKITEILPSGYQFPDLCRVRIVMDDQTVEAPDFRETRWVQVSRLSLETGKTGRIEAYYLQQPLSDDADPFLKEEQKLLNTVAERLAQTLVLLDHYKTPGNGSDNNTQVEQSRNWRIMLEMVRETDRTLYLRIIRKMLHYLCWSGDKEAMEMLQGLGADVKRAEVRSYEETNQPLERRSLDNLANLGEPVFALASRTFHHREITRILQKWIQEEKSGALVKIVENTSSTTGDIIDAIIRHYPLLNELSAPAEKALRVALIRRFFFSRLQFINAAKNFIGLDDFHEIAQKIIHPPGGHGRLGGKSAGMFLASRILKRNPEFIEEFGDIKVPQTWYLSSDCLWYFMSYNNLEDVIEQKYKEIDEIRIEYPYIIQVFKNSLFPPELVRGLAQALDDFGEVPLIVRSSSLLEDSLGTAFSGKYKSLFLANQGSKSERLEALMDAIAEVYASVFGPDPIEYRSERGLLDFMEEMGILIQEVVGNRFGKYFLPGCGGVAFSHNEFRWSPRIRREDGLIRLVPGLGTRAVDRLSDDYPVLIAPGQPSLRVNVTPDEILRYSPRKIDVINLETRAFESHSIAEVIEDAGDISLYLKKWVSVYDNGRFRQYSPLLDNRSDNLVVTFKPLIDNTPFVARINRMLILLKEAMGVPVDVEFATDGTDLFLLQCRPQSHARSSVASPIPKDIPEKNIVFNARQYISNGTMPEITHIVYVDPEEYGRLPDRESMTKVGQIISRLNKILPKRQFILMGPGRWGSRGDIKLGVKVTYSDFNNTAALIEIARKKGNYLPELSFGTHFFQDLVESEIRYLPLYPDNDDIIFNDRYLSRTRNILPEILPEYESFASTVRVIDVPKSSDGKILRVLMNADLDEAVAFLTEPSPVQPLKPEADVAPVVPMEDHWRWRLRMAEILASRLEAKRFGVAALYIFGSTKNATAGPASDIDLLVHFQGDEVQRRELQIWMDGWSISLSEINYLRTGYRTDGLLDVHLVTDDDIRNKTSWALKIDAITDSARLLTLQKE